MASHLVFAIFLSFLICAAVGGPTETRLSDARQCRIQRLTASQPSRRIESEGGVTEMWNEFEDQFQCAGVAAMRNIIQPNSLSLPNFSPSPRLVYIQQGRGLVGIAYPGCAETYHSRGQQSPRGTEGSQEQQGGRRMGEQHQKVHRIRQGDIVALPAGVAHWCFNDGNEELVAVSVTDLNNQANQLDQKQRSFYLGGGQPQRRMQGTESQQERETYQNIFRAFDENLMAESFNVPADVIRRMQREDNRGYIVKVQGGGMSMLRPEEEEECEGSCSEGRRGNGLEETICTMRINQYLDNPREADIYSRQAGRLNSVNMHKLPILRYLQMSAEKGNLYPNAMHAPHWSMNSHSIIYVTQGEGQVQVVGHNGQTVLNDRVRQGDLFVVPQYFASTVRAGNNGFEWVAIKTSSLPMKSPLVGQNSVFKAMPMEVIANSYQISNHEAQNLKYNREHHSLLLPPRTTSS